MKKVILAIFLSVLSPVLMGSSQATPDGIILKNYPSNSKLKKIIPAKTEELLGNIIVLPIEPFDEIEAAKIISRVSKLPHSILEKTADHHIKLKLFIGKLTDNPTAQALKGIIPRGYENGTTWDGVPGIGGSKTVLVKIGASEKGKGHGSVNLELHELAHSIDHYLYGRIKNNQLFLSAWENEKAILFPGQDYFLTFPEEYFAETFAMYYLNANTRKLLKDKAPKTYMFIKNLN